MMKAVKYYLFGRNANKLARVPVLNADRMSLIFSTRFGSALVNFENNNWVNYNPKKNHDFTLTSNIYTDSISSGYSPVFTGDINVIFSNSLRDVYSIAMIRHLNFGSSEYYNITSIKDFFGQFPNLYSIYINLRDYYNKLIVISGDFAELPNAVEKVLLGELSIRNQSTSLHLNVDKYGKSELKFFKQGDVGVQTRGYLHLTGDLKNLPKDLYYFRLLYVINPFVTYTAGRKWASTFERLSLPVALTKTETDNILIDLDNSITTAVGEKIISLGGSRSVVSNIAVANLQAKGFSVTPANAT